MERTAGWVELLVGVERTAAWVELLVGVERTAAWLELLALERELLGALGSRWFDYFNPVVRQG